MAGKSKKEDFRVMSKLSCPVCGKPIKANVANRKLSKDILCYDHWRDTQKSTTRTARECKRLGLRKCDRVGR